MSNTKSILEPLIKPQLKILLIFNGLTWLVTFVVIVFRFQTQQRYFGRERKEVTLHYKSTVFTILLALKIHLQFFTSLLYILGDISRLVVRGVKRYLQKAQLRSHQLWPYVVRGRGSPVSGVPIRERSRRGKRVRRCEWHPPGGRERSGGRPSRRRRRGRQRGSPRGGR